LTATPNELGKFMDSILHFIDVLDSSQDVFQNTKAGWLSHFTSVGKGFPDLKSKIERIQGLVRNITNLYQLGNAIF